MGAIDEIKKLILEEQFEITVHARERMAERGVSTEGLISLIIYGADEEKWLNHRIRKM